MKKVHILSRIGVSLTYLILLGFGCQRKTTTGSAPNSPPTEATSTAATILVSTEKTDKYCNGADMDSAGYQKTITELRTVEIPPYQNITEHVKAILLVATSGMCRQILASSNLSVREGAFHIPPIDAWAGASITMCSCKPQVEMNALRIPGITKVVWDEPLVIP